MSLKSVIRSFRRTSRYHGVGSALTVLLVSAFRRVGVFERVHLYLFDRPPPDRSLPAPEKARLATLEDLLPLLGSAEFDLEDFDAATVSGLFARGHRCVVNLLQGRTVGYAWVNPEEILIPRAGLALELTEGEVHAYKGFTHPDFRGRSIGNDRYLFWLSNLPGISGVVSHFSFDNHSTRKRVAKLGMTWMGTVTLIGIGPLRHEFRSGVFLTRKVRKL